MLETWSRPRLRMEEQQLCHSASPAVPSCSSAFRAGRPSPERRKLNSHDITAAHSGSSVGGLPRQGDTASSTTKANQPAVTATACRMARNALNS